MKVTLVQPQLFWQDPVANRSNIEEMLWQNTSSTDLIILPETFNTGFSPEKPQLAEPYNGPTMQWMKQLVQQFKASVCGSLFIKNSGEVENTFVYIDKNEHISTYAKRHLFGNEKIGIRRGKSPLKITDDAINIGVSTCYDLRFPAWCRTVAENNEVLLFVANWPASRIHHWKSLLMARAIENQCYVIGCNITGDQIGGITYNGNSMVVSFDGTILAEANSDACLLESEIDIDALKKYREKYPFLIDRDHLI